MTFSDKIIDFNRTLVYKGTLPGEIRIMNPFKESPEAGRISESFYRKYYSDSKERKIILGINPGRFGAGITGIPFTDTKRLSEFCQISAEGINSHELSSVFIYLMIEKYGGVEKFYNDYYINSVCPLGFVKMNNKGREVNFNYYDDMLLADMVKEFIIVSLRRQLSFGIDTSTVYCLGTGKNYKYLLNLNKELHLFDKLIPLEHPRFIMQYRSKSVDDYIDKYIKILKMKRQR